MAKFEVGNRVKVIDKSLPTFDLEGVIEGVDFRRGLYEVELPGSWGYYSADELAPADTAAEAAPGGEAGATSPSVFVGIERRIMKSGDTRFLEGINEPMGIETARYINNLSIELHNTNKVMDALMTDLATVRAERDALAAALEAHYDEDSLVEFANLCSQYPKEARLDLFKRVFAALDTARPASEGEGT